MIILDSNIFIYLANGTLDRKCIKDDVAYASISRIETLGYEHLPAGEQLLLRALLKVAAELPLDNAIIDQAIELRQTKQMSLGDSIVAATALTYGYTLWTANTSDFKHIPNIKRHNPLDR